MEDTKTRIAAGLESAFVRDGFAQPSVEDLRDAAGVSLRTLYKYTPSRAEMVHAALEHRHRRYMAQILAPVPTGPALPVILDRIAHWMRTEAATGCLFHAAVAANPQDRALRDLLRRHKQEVALRACAMAGIPGCETEVTLILDGFMQGWPLSGETALTAAKRLLPCVMA